MSVRADNAARLDHWLRMHPGGGNRWAIMADLWGAMTGTEYTWFNQAIAYHRDHYPISTHALVVSGTGIYRLSDDPDEVRLYRKRRAQRAYREMRRTWTSTIRPHLEMVDPGALPYVERQMRRTLEDVEDFIT